MNGLLAVFAREIGERRMVFLVAAALGLASLAAPLLLAGRSTPGETAFATALVLALALSGLLAAALGASVIAGELADRRLAFYFARPLSGWAIWGGKLGAALALALGSGAVVLLPAALLYRTQEPELLPRLALAWPAGVLLLLLACHALGLIGRARTAWTFLDLGAALALAGLAWFNLHELGLWVPGFELERLAPAAALALILALAVASAVQVAGGRTDLRRAHRLLTLTLWGGLLAAALSASGYAAWYLHPAPSDLKIVASVAGDRAARWVEIVGKARGLDEPDDAYFLLDRSTGRWLQIRPPWLWGGIWQARSESRGVIFARDGRSAVWLEHSDPQRWELVSIDLTAPRPAPRSTQLSFGPRPQLALSPDGRRIAAAEGNRIVVAEVATGRLLASIPRGERAGPFFVAANRLRFFSSHIATADFPARDVVIEDLDLATARAHTVARIRLAELDFYWQVSRDGERLLIHNYGGPGRGATVLYDAGIGRPLAALPLALGASGRVEFMPSGRLLEQVRYPDRHELRLLTRDGALAPGTQAFRLPGPYWVWVGGEVSATELLAMEVGPNPPQSRAGRPTLPLPFRLLRLDLARGTSTPLAQGIAPRIELLPEPLAGSGPAAFLARAAQGWTWIDAAGRRTPLSPTGAGG